MFHYHDHDIEVTIIRSQIKWNHHLYNEDITLQNNNYDIINNNINNHNNKNNNNNNNDDDEGNIIPPPPSEQKAGGAHCIAQEMLDIIEETWMLDLPARADHKVLPQCNHNWLLN